MASADKILASVAARVLVSRYLDYREYLEVLYQELKTELGSYSYLSFAEDLGFSKSNVVHLMIRGKRPLSVKAAAKVADILQLKSKDRKYFEDLVAYQNSRDPQERETIFQDLVHLKTREVHHASDLSAQLAFLTEWYHSAIYELCQTSAFNPDPKLLAASLMPRIRPEQARKSLELLLELGLLKHDEKTNTYSVTQERLTTGDEIASLAVTRYHQKMIEIGKESITAVESGQRDISSISISIPLHLLPELKTEISQFRKKILALSEQAKDPDAVYQMNIQLFPLSRSKGSV